MTLDEMITAADEWIASGRDRIGKRSVPLYAATRPMAIWSFTSGDDGKIRLAMHETMAAFFVQERTADNDAAECKSIGLGGVTTAKRQERDAWMGKLAVRALHNQGEPYYTQEQS